MNFSVERLLETALSPYISAVTAIVRSNVLTTGFLCIFGLLFIIRRVFGVESKSEANESNAEDATRDDVPSYEAPESADFERVPFEFKRRSDEELVSRSECFLRVMEKRRTIRDFAPDPVPEEVLDNLIKTAGSSPSGANAQPWTFVVVSDPAMKAEVRRIVELEEKINYERRMGKKWVDDIKPFKVSWEKAYLTEAPHLILVFKQVHGFDPITGKKKAHYYQEISVSLAVGILVAAIQNAGLVTLTSTPLNCGPGLRALFKRPDNEKLVLLLPIGFPSPDATVPKLDRKELDQFCVKF